MFDRAWVKRSESWKFYCFAAKRCSCTVWASVWGTAQQLLTLWSILLADRFPPNRRESISLGLDVEQSPTMSFSLSDHLSVFCSRSVLSLTLIAAGNEGAHLLRKGARRSKRIPQRHLMTRVTWGERRGGRQRVLVSAAPTWTSPKCAKDGGSPRRRRRHKRHQAENVICRPQCCKKARVGANFHPHRGLVNLN